MSSKRSLLWQLDRDVLHCLYSEWLGSWRDLRALDVACAGENGGDRAAWLSSLSGLVMAGGLDKSREYFHEQVIKFYKWLGSRNIFLVEDFPVSLGLLEDLQNALNLATYCPSLRSIDIDRNEGTGVSQREGNMKAMQDRFRIFLKQCTRLNSVTIKPHTKSVATENIDAFSEMTNELENDEVDSMLLSVMTNELENNTLVKIDLEIHSASTSLESITGLLSKHTSSIRDVMIEASASTQWSFDDVLDFLGQNRISLRRLTIGFNPLSSQRLLAYLSCFGTHIEILEVGRNYRHCIDLSITEEVLLSIGRACPRLRTLLLSNKGQHFSDHTPVRPSELYHICPDLRTLSFPSFWLALIADDEKREITFSDYGSRLRNQKEDWIGCVRTVLDRCGYKNVSFLNHSGRVVTDDIQWDIVMSTLSPFITEMEVVMQEATLVETVRDLPRLEKLHLRSGGLEFGDVSLAAIVEHASARLRMLRIHEFPFRGTHFTDEMISKMIRACQRLQVLRIPNAGCESVLAVKDHGCLIEVELEDVVAEESAIASILHEEGENQHWPPTLRRGVVVRGNVYRFDYKEKSHTWAKSWLNALLVL